MIATVLTPDFVRGTTEFEPTVRGLKVHRLPPHVRSRDIDPQLTLMDSQPSGVRVAFTTAAAEVTLELHVTRVAYRGMNRARGAVDVVIDGVSHSSHPLAAGDYMEIDMQTGTPTFTAGQPEHITVSGLGTRSKTVEMWLPHNEQVELVAVRADAPITPAPATGPVWVHHGSSISHGSNATSPTGIWPAVAARAAGLQLHNLGFGGSAMVDPFMARVIRDTPADLISVKLGINVVNFDAMRLRAFVPAVHGFLDTIRDGHPTTPLLLVSPIFCGIHEDTPGPGAVDPATIGTGSVQFIATGTPGDTAAGQAHLDRDPRRAGRRRRRTRRRRQPALPRRASPLQR